MILSYVKARGKLSFYVADLKNTEAGLSKVSLQILPYRNYIDCRNCVAVFNLVECSDATCVQMVLKQGNLENIVFIGLK